jgi:hypothetical protein
VKQVRVAGGQLTNIPKALRPRQRIAREELQKLRELGLVFNGGLLSWGATHNFPIRLDDTCMIVDAE